MSNIRYAGSKHKLRNVILARFPQEYIGGLFSNRSMTYVEPFFGSGAVGWQVLSGLSDSARVVINDIDYGLSCLWYSVKHHPDELCAKIRAAQLSPSIFSDYKQTDGDRNVDVCESGFRKLLLHQMSFSGLGAKAGGPIGGKEQSNSMYDIGCRWNVVEQCAKVRQRNILLERFDAQIHCEDFIKVMHDADSADTMFYLDPPYVDKGADLYKHSFNEQQHIDLAVVAHRIKGKMLLSYDDDPLVRELYADMNIQSVNATYSICTSRKNSELLITNF